MDTQTRHLKNTGNRAILLDRTNHKDVQKEYFKALRLRMEKAHESEKHQNRNACGTVQQLDVQSRLSHAGRK